MAARKKLGELLVEAGVVSAEDVRDALGHQKALPAAKKLGEVLGDTHGVTPKAVAHALARQFDLPFVELPVIPAELAALVPRELQEAHKIIPFRLEVDGMAERLHVAVSDPADLNAIDQLRFTLRKPLRVHVAARDDLDHALSVLRGDAPAVEPIPLSADDEEPEAEFEVVHGPAAAVHPDESGAAVILTRPGTAASADAGIAVADANVTAQELDDLLGGAPAPVAAPPLTLLKFDGSRISARDASQRSEKLEFDEKDLEVLETMEKLAGGAAAAIEGEKVRPEQMVAALVRLLIRKGVIQELEFLDELTRK